MNKILIICSFLIPTILLFQCKTTSEEHTVSEAYQKEIQDWRTKRVNNLIAPKGWTALAGLFWLEDGKNTFGSNEENSMVFPEKAPENMGAFNLENDSVTVTVNPDVKITVGDSPISEIGLVADIHGSPTIMHYQSLNWNLIKRGEKFGIRLRDTLHENRQNFKGIDYFPINEKWKLDATFEAYEGGKKMKFKNVLDKEVDQTIEGKLIFEVDGKTYSLDVLGGGEDDFFVIFADETTGDNTYGGGRYMYTPRPKNGTKTFIDFNKAYTPPCGFTDFATCLLPPAQNRLTIAIEAGEKFHGH
jgi:uncharacterized protein (DUF1684 family)